MAAEKKRRRLPRAERREELLAAGEAVLRARGLEARVEDVMRQAKAAQGTFYVYFDSWEAFLIALRDRVFERLQADFPQVEDRSPEAWRALFADLPRRFADMTAELEGLHAALFHGPIARTPATDPRYDVILRLRKLYAAAAAVGAARAEDPLVAARLAFSALHEAADLIEAGRDRQSVLAACAAMITAL